LAATEGITAIGVAAAEVGVAVVAVDFLAEAADLEEVAALSLSTLFSRSASRIDDSFVELFRM
jgi:hypothetical protein